MREGVSRGDDRLSSDAVLASPAPPVSVADAEALAAEEFGISGVAHRLTGEKDANFRVVADGGRQYVLKAAHPAESWQETDLQSSVLVHLERTAPDLPLPRLVRPVTAAALQVT